MKKRIVSLAVAGLSGAILMTAPALAATTVIEFKRDSGEVQVVSLDGQGTATLAEGVTVPYTYDAEKLTMCFQLSAEQKNCAVFAEAKGEPKAGDSVRYTASDGAQGTATILEVKE